MTAPRTAPTTVPAAAPAAPAAAGRAPLAARVGAGLLALLATVSTAGLVLFSVVWADDPFGPGLVFFVVYGAAALTAVVALPSLLRGERTGWLLATGWAVAYSYWSVYKVFGEQEFESGGHLAVGLAVCALLLSPSVRRYADR